MFRSQSPAPSIHEADTAGARSRRSKRGWHRGGVAVACLALASAAAAGALALGSSDPSAPDVFGTSPAQGTAGGDGPHLDVVLDGWSVTTLGSADVTATVDGVRTPVTLQPLGADAVRAIAGRSPQLVQQALARLVTDDPSLACTRTGCSASGQPVDVAVLADLPRVPVLGQVYSGWKVRAGLYGARVTLPKATSNVSVQADGWAPVVVSGGPARAGAEQAPVLVSAGLGRLFETSAAWLGTGKDPVRYDSPSSSPVTGDAADVLASERPALIAAEGLASPLAVAKDWTASHLTYASSPTTGCGPEALCVPGRLSSTTRQLSYEVAPACSVDGDRGVIAVDQRVVAARLPAPVHQYGLGGGRWGAAPAVTTGQVKVRTVVGALFSGEPLVHRAAGGRVDAGLAVPVPTSEVVSSVRFAGSHWTVCTR